MVIVTEKKTSSLREDTQVSLDDVIGLSGFSGYNILGNIYAESLYVTGAGSLVQGPGMMTPQDVSLVIKKRAIVSFPIKDIRSIALSTKGNVRFYTKNGIVIEFMKN
jgi:hypothetical protein